MLDIYRERYKDMKKIIVLKWELLFIIQGANSIYALAMTHHKDTTNYLYSKTVHYKFSKPCTLLSTRFQIIELIPKRF